MIVSDKFRAGARAEKRLSRAQIETLCGAKAIDAQRLGDIDGVSTPDRLMPNRAVFIERFTPELATALSQSAVRDVLVVVTEEYRHSIPQPRLISAHPRGTFSVIVRALFEYRASVQTLPVAPSAHIDSSAGLCVGVTIGNGSSIGAGAYIYPNVTIGDRVHIGRNCVIKSGSVLGQPGFRVYRDENNVPQHFPHVGGVVIGDNVEIGALNTVVAGTIHPTVVEDHVKTDDHVHIAHNCHIGARTLITACAELSGSVQVGPDCWIGPNSSVRDGLTIGQGAFVGIGANVVSHVAPRTTVIGNPARPYDNAKI